MIAPFVVKTNDMERVLADVDADRGDDISAGSCAWHGMLLILAAPCRLRVHEARARRVHLITGRIREADIPMRLPDACFDVLNLAISEMQETSHWPTHRWNVMSQQRKSNRQHPNTYYREREETQHSATEKCDTSRHPHPYRTLPTKPVQIVADPGRDVILEAVHFLVEIGIQRHPRSSGMHSICSYDFTARIPSLD